ncbi:MAG: aldo/keto reductase [Eubacteriales bacterium]
MAYTGKENRYDNMEYRYAGASGLKLPVIALGLWHNFGTNADKNTMKQLCFTAFDQGITYFDLANNYGPEPGSAETNFGEILATEMSAYRDEMVIATKAGYGMWQGPYGDWGSRKYLIASLNQSLKRMKLDYVDIFYHHRMDPNTPLEETMLALADIVRSGKALYVGLSNYDGETMEKASQLLEEYQVPFIVNQNNYSMFNDTVEKNGLQKACTKEKKGMVAFCPLAQGLLSTKYLNDIPEDSRIKTSGIFLKEDAVTPEKLSQIRSLNEIAQNRGQSLAQMALSYILSREAMTTALIGASKPEQITENVACLQNMKFSSEELSQIKKILD